MDRIRLYIFRLIPSFWTFAVLFYLLRSIAEPLKYLFFIAFGILLVSYTFFLITDIKKTSFIRFLSIAKEFLIVGGLLAAGIILSSQIEALSIKGFINFLGISIFYLIYIEFRDHINLPKLFKGWLYIATAIGILGLLKWFNFLFELNLGFFSIFYNSGSSLVSEYNLYAFYFFISAIIYFYALYKNYIQIKLIANLSLLFLFLINVALSGSRRGLFLLAVAFILTNIILLAKRKSKHNVYYKTLFYLNTLLTGMLLIFLALIPFRSKIITERASQSKVAATLYRYNKIVFPGITYSAHYSKLWPKNTTYKNDRTNWKKFATFNNQTGERKMTKYRDLKNEYWRNFTQPTNTDNLLYNGDFEYGKQFWGINAPDSIKHEIIDTPYGKAIRVRRFEGEGYWPLKYIGREVFYHKGHTYTFKFKFRVIKGSGVPFSIGWWVNEGEGYKNNLKGIIRKLGDGWFEFTASYKFKEDHYNLQTFMNSQHANSVIDFADIELFCNDTSSQQRYLDQVMKLEGHNLFYNSNFEHGLKFWGTATPDYIDHKLIETEYGKAIRVTRKEGKGYWPLTYEGREIYYYQDLTYYFRFKYRVIKGENIPFNIGWWLQGVELNPHNLSKDVFPISNGWYECIASHKFEKDFYGRIPTFMNSQKANTIIDFADIELICNDTLNRPMYADENLDLIRILEEQSLNQQPEYEKSKLLSDRVLRWKYALELWKNQYTWPNKLIGKGFDYQDDFGRKFYPDEDRIDYPHNPIISAFLYSGIFGGLFYLYFLTLSFIYYWKYRKQHMLFFILYLITFTFIFISSDSHFNVPIFAMLSLVPFITRYVVNEKELKNPV